MSASERLRELAKEAGGFEFIPVNPSDLGYVQRNEAEEILTDALPLIADVVEAAETMNVRWYGPWQRNGLKMAAKRQRDALTALKEALDAG